VILCGAPVTLLLANCGARRSKRKARECSRSGRRRSWASNGLWPSVRETLDDHARRINDQLAGVAELAVAGRTQIRGRGAGFCRLHPCDGRWPPREAGPIHRISARGAIRMVGKSLTSDALFACADCISAVGAIQRRRTHDVEAWSRRRAFRRPADLSIPQPEAHDVELHRLGFVDEVDAAENELILGDLTIAGCANVAAAPSAPDPERAVVRQASIGDLAANQRPECLNLVAEEMKALAFGHGRRLV
jgi:hypothetical protein